MQIISLGNNLPFFLEIIVHVLSICHLDHIVLKDNRIYEELNVSRSEVIKHFRAQLS